MLAAQEGRGGRAAFLALAVAVHVALLAPYTSGNLNDFDARHLYFPLAEGLLREGLAFFAREASLQAPPFAYAFPAIFGASLPVVRMVDIALSAATLLLVYGAAARMRSPLAGLAAAAAFALCPLLKPYLAAPITEPPYLFLHALWIWCLARWLSGGAAGFAIAAGIAAGLAVLTRATSFYWLVAVAAVFLLAWMRSPREARRRALAPLAGHAAGLALPLAFIAKNWLLFAFPFFATGAGNALYLGNNPVTGGYDPTYVGLVYDVGAIARDQSHLTLEAERLLRGVAGLMLSEQDPAELLRAHARKLLAFVFVSNAEGDALLLRGWRIALVVLAAVGAMSIGSRALRWLVLGTLVYNVAVHVPVLFTLRYSVGAIDLWLILLSGVGVARLVEGRERRLAAATAAALAAGWTAGALAFLYGGEPQPDAYAVPRVTVWEGQPRAHRFDGGEAAIDVPIDGAPLFRKLGNNVLVIDAALHAPQGGCGPLQVSFRAAGPGEAEASRSLRLPSDGRVRRLQVGWMKLGLNREGRLRIAASCPAGSRLELAKLAVVAPLGSLDYRERLLGEAPVFALER